MIEVHFHVFFHDVAHNSGQFSAWPGKRDHQTFLEHQVGKARVAQQLGLGLAQAQNSTDQLAVVELARARAEKDGNSTGQDVVLLNFQRAIERADLLALRAKELLNVS